MESKAADMTQYLIEYFGIGGIDESITYTGGISGLLQEITWIEERGGWNVSATNEAGKFVYEDGGLCRDCMK